MVTQASSLDEFSDIAPYADAELPERLLALCSDPELLDAACALRFKIATNFLKPFVRPLVRSRLKREVSKIKDRATWHEMMVHFIESMLETTTDGFTYSGIESIPRDRPCVFISNHRDITLDPVLVNYSLWLNGHPTCKIAIGDNLLDLRVGAEFMRINDSFVVVRNAPGLKAQYAAMSKTSRYIRYVLGQGQSVWIAQREGRSKDGADRTDPAVLKMFALAYREQSKDINHMLEQFNLVPTTLTYELDPCATRKAMELAERERTGNYVKSEHEDRDSLVQGIRGFKGRVHVAYGHPMDAQYRDADELAQAIDVTMTENRRSYPTFLAARDVLNGNFVTLEQGRVKEEFSTQWQSLEGRERELLLQQYANQARDQAS
ncbi:MAG: 1-acyl-sn-glycerol-3-phosphate acyltransferase [Gammaproteobacteria bacterium]|nr:1-acyl-sn-glycerol-3-phosphate acyltransferase [Gammaproteobacteria bacterium]